MRTWIRLEKRLNAKTCAANGSKKPIDARNITAFIDVLFRRGRVAAGLAKTLPFYLTAPDRSPPEQGDYPEKIETLFSKQEDIILAMRAGRRLDCARETGRVPLYAASGGHATTWARRRRRDHSMNDIAFLLNGTPVRVSADNPTRTLLDWLRETRGLKGTKEGCNEGDCGACTVMVTDSAGVRALNACILFLPQLHGKSVRTVEGLTGPSGQMHPVQEAMVEMHGSQCGFCTPGFVMSMAVAQLNGATDHDDNLAGNLCRCTGYAPIIRAAEAAAGQPVPDWVKDAPDAGAGPAPFAPRLPTNSPNGMPRIPMRR